MFCKNCGAQMNDNQAVCLNCGIQAGMGFNFCPNCGSQTPPNAAVCVNCGVALQQPKANNLNGQDKITMALVCFFLGGLGIHNFMMGETKKGVLKIVLDPLCGLGGLLALIDFIRILTDSYVADANKFI